MMRRLDVKLWGRTVGTLVAAPTTRGEAVAFYFDADFLNSGLDIAPLRASIRGNAARLGLPVAAERERLFGGLPSFIADSVPDHWGNTVFSEWAKARGISMRKISPLDRLAYIGRRGMGALEFLPPSAAELENPFRVEIAELSALAQRALSEAKTFRASGAADFAIESLMRVGTSAGGRRPKAVVNVCLATGECYSGQVATPAPGFTPMIVKFDEHSSVPSTRLEYAFYLMARAAGLRMMESRLIDADGEAHFLTERFDRTANGEKIHVQTLAAMNPFADSYEALLQAAEELGLPATQTRQLFLQAALNIACGNIDDHNKNFAFTMDRQGTWSAAPAYDFTFAVSPSAPAYANGHSMTLGGKTHAIDRADLRALATRFGVKDADSLIDSALTAAGRFREFAAQAGLDAHWTDAVAAELARRASRLARP